MMEGQVEPQQGTRVGGLLRSCRLRARLDLADVAPAVHVRRAFLEAIENERYELLPGAIYAQSFVRVYAEYLGLDGDAVAKRFKAEIADRDSVSPLHFPLPVAEGETPKGGMLLLGALIAGIAYGAWYVMTSRGVDMAELIAPLPERLERLVGGGGGVPSSVAPAAGPVSTGGAAPGAAGMPAAPLASPPMQTLGATSPAAAPGTRERLNPSAASGSTPAAAPPDVVMPVQVAGGKVVPDLKSGAHGTAEAAAARFAAEQPGLAPRSVPGFGAADSGPAVAAMPPPQTAASGSAPPGAVAVEPAAVGQAITAAGNGQALAAEPPDGGIGAGAAAGGRIVLQAKADSWVEVRDPDSRATLVARLLRQGDVYRVPDRQGLTLVTGNAGGIVVLVDGEAVPPLGRTGAVRRGILLDPESLRRGVETAASQ